MRTRNQSRQLKQSSLSSNSIGVSSKNGGKLLRQSISCGSSRVDKQDSYLQQCEYGSKTENSAKPKDKQEVLTVKSNTSRAEDCCIGVRGTTLSDEGHSLHDKSEEIDESDWEDDSTPMLGSQTNLVGGLTVEFSGSLESPRRKPIRQPSAEDKEVAELVHKVHLLCLLARGRFVDRACDDPLIQASLLSLLPMDLLKISEVARLSTDVLAPLVHWFHDNFHLKNIASENKQFHLALALALETREGTPEEITALFVALLRALNLTTRFVSILDAASLKPHTNRSQSLGPVEGKPGRGIFKFSTLMVDKTNKISKSPVKSSWKGKGNACESSMNSANKCKESISRCKKIRFEDSTVSSKLDDQTVDPEASEAQNDALQACSDNNQKCSKRKGDLEFEMQLEMALSATARIHTNDMDSAAKDLHSNPAEGSPHNGRLKKAKTEESPSSLSGISTAIGSERVGAPLYWAEVYCSGENLTGKWVHIDAVNEIIDGEQKVEASASACKKSLRYVVAFAGSGAKDVTRRYCLKWYKVASQRINPLWWDAVLTPLRELQAGATEGTLNLEKQPERSNIQALGVSHFPTEENCHDYSSDCMNVDFKTSKDGSGMKSKPLLRSSSITTRNSLEDMELETRALTEPLPTNQQAYKSHQLYVIERWLTKYQILHPKDPILGFCSGHPVYPRACVQTLKTKERWLREGLQVKANELPAKMLERSLKLGKTRASEGNDNDEADSGATIQLYGRWQTEPLCLPHAVNGIVPKNERGQVDVWSEKCLPPGTVHLRLPRIVPITKRLEIDFAPAMVGFEFRNGRSFPVFDGVVVCAEFKDAILEAYAEEKEKREAEEIRRNETQAMSRWFQLLSSIVTRQRLNNLYNNGSSSRNSNENNNNNNNNNNVIDGLSGGGRTPGLGSQQARVHEMEFDMPSTVFNTEDHQHVFMMEDQTYDEVSSLLTKRCRCGFSVQVEEL